MAPLVPLPQDLIPFLDRYLPRKDNDDFFVTLTYAQSLDSRISKGKGIQTIISHPETKTMTHYIRSHHDAILVGINTVLADDPGLNCRYCDHDIRPIIIDPSFKLRTIFQRSKLHENCVNGVGLAPLVVIDRHSLVEGHGIDTLVLDVDPKTGKFSWLDIFKALREKGIRSVMVEGGATVINSLLRRGEDGLFVVNSLIVTVAPIYLGSGGVEVSPREGLAVEDVSWWRGKRDVVCCGRLTSEAGRLAADEQGGEVSC
ncbi:DEKNAAC105196 [Brettanomyces naardenensis]|uniref:2,5-diamino-6-ribosylamino-4(3H)-pyrimidinone 5'-phosphate reductase n=1 Tax=Brettanomyces naardenensis TaxID=13370 RepID=A0A448YT03_BRENA|nr:DEKNAAC105196 [Brettanomyces naardenensis]